MRRQEMRTADAWLSGYDAAVNLVEMKLVKIAHDDSEAAMLALKVLRSVLDDMRKARPEQPYK